MFRALIAVGRFPGIFYKRARGIGHRRIVLVLLEAFGSAASASIYCTPYYPCPSDLAAMENEKASEEPCEEMREPETPRVGGIPSKSCR